MSELIASSANFYLNAEVYNSTDVPIDALIKISDQDDILKFQEHWAVHIVRWAVDTQASLYYVEPNNDTWVTLTTVRYSDDHNHRTDMTKHFIDQRTLRMTNGASTLADFLAQLNDSVPIVLRDRSTPAGGAQDRSGRWTVTPSGAFKFQAVITNRDGNEVTDSNLSPYHPLENEYMVNIRMSDSMRKILGFKNANVRVLGNASPLRQYKEALANFMDELSTYRSNIDNWRWSGAHLEWHKCNWLTEMWYIINGVLLRGTPLDRNGTVPNANNTKHTKDIGDFDSVGRVAGLGFWEANDYMLSNYMTPSGRGGAGGNSDSTHEYTMFSKLENHNARTHQTTLRDIDNNPIHNISDHRWSAVINQNGSAYANEDEWSTTVANSGRRAFIHSAKLTWGTWSRAYILKVANARQIYINRADLTHVQGANIGNVGDGGVASFGIPPQIGDTIYIPGSANYDGSGVIAGVINDYDKMQRGIITEVELKSSIERVVVAANLNEIGNAYEGEDAYLVTFDTELESNADRFAHLNCLQADGGNFNTGTNVGDPRARVIYGTRRLPCNPMVYFGIVDVTVNAVANQIQFASSKEFPVSVGDSVYIGHSPHASKQVHLVIGVDYDLGLYTIEAHDVAQLTADTIVIGMVRDSVYNVTVATDKAAMEVTAPCIGCRESNGFDTDVDHSIPENRLLALEFELANSISGSHIRISPDTTYGLRDLTEEETNTPSMVGYDGHSGTMRLGVLVVRGGGGGDATQNNIVVADLQEHIGASARFTRASDMDAQANNMNSSPSNYFLVDMPEETGIYAQPVFNAFMNGHYREDWFLHFGRVVVGDTINGTGDLTLVGGQNVRYNDIEVLRVRMIRRGLGYRYKICGLATLDSAPENTHKNKKFICYNGNRTQYPGYWVPVAQHATFDTATQFFYAQMTADDGTFDHPIFCKLLIDSGSPNSDGVQAIFKGNQTIDITDNTNGINLAVRTQDYMRSEKSGQVDIAFPYKSISITSNDLMAVPERSGDANILQPILSSYSIPTMFDAGTSTSGKIESFTSTPYGTITFSEGGARRYHNLSSIPGGLRQFTIRCVLDPKDDTAPKTPIKLPPGGRFSVQFVFVKKV